MDHKNTNNNHKKSATKSAFSNKKFSVNKSRTCRNVIIHGYCKFEGKGCEFNHEKSTRNDQINMKSMNVPLEKQSKRPSSAKVAMNTATPKETMETVQSNTCQDQEVSTITSNETSTIFKPTSNKSLKFNVESPAFNPSFDTTIQQEQLLISEPKLKPTAAPFQPLQLGKETSTQSQSHALPPFNNQENMNLQENQDPPLINQQFKDEEFQQILQQFESMDTQNDMSMAKELYYQTPATSILPQRHLQPRDQLQYHLYTNPSPHGLRLQANERSIHSFFMSDTLREDLLKRNEALLQTEEYIDPETKKVVSELDVYHSLYPLDVSGQSRVFGYKTSVFKSVSSVDGGAYVLYRVHGFRITSQDHLANLNKWKSVKHSNVVSFKEAFTTNSFGDSSLIMAFDYHPNSTSLLKLHLSSFPSSNEPVSEDLLWSYITQICSALQSLHQQNLPIRSIEPSKILVTGKNRIRLNCCGCMDVLSFDQVNQDIYQFKQQDLLHFGQLILTLGTGTLGSIQNVPKSVEFMSMQYSTDLNHALQYLLSPPSEFKSIDDVVMMIGPRFLKELNAVNSYTDQLESELSKEIENGRLVRLLCKLGFINERPEFDLDPSWSETGDRYLLKLFRDYVFHQVDAEGNPVIDLVHVLSCLNKLDTGFEERIMLMSRDEQSCLIVSFKDLKHCIDSTFRELINKATKL